jgi:hypothetical protein
MKEARDEEFGNKKKEAAKPQGNQSANTQNKPVKEDLGRFFDSDTVVYNPKAIKNKKTNVYVLGISGGGHMSFVQNVFASKLKAKYTDIDFLYGYLCGTLSSKLVSIYNDKAVVGFIKKKKLKPLVDHEMIVMVLFDFLLSLEHSPTKWIVYGRVLTPMLMNADKLCDRSAIIIYGDSVRRAHSNIQSGKTVSIGGGSDSLIDQFENDYKDISELEIVLKSSGYEKAVINTDTGEIM